ncbi:MAG: hypothetical protein HFF17_05845 [Oscillospiraceae bacterium]|nr:hypothetical protein [Oscillospiraceae bacterium]
MPDGEAHRPRLRHSAHPAGSLHLYRGIIIDNDGSNPESWNDHGSIPEVPMTSQRSGAPFAPGEALAAYQACGHTGRCRIDLDGDRKALTQTADGDSAVFRYVDAASAPVWLRIRCAGIPCGRAVVVDGSMVPLPGALAELTELRLVFHGPKAFSLYELTLEGDNTPCAGICVSPTEGPRP